MSWPRLYALGPKAEGVDTVTCLPLVHPDVFDERDRRRVGLVADREADDVGARFEHGVATTADPATGRDWATFPAATATDVERAAPAPNSRYVDRADTISLGNKLAEQYQLDPTWVRAMLGQAKYKESVARLIMPGSATGAKNWALYRSRFVEPVRIKAGVAFWRTYQSDLQRAEDQWGVPAHIIAGILGVETIYGRNVGNYRVLDALTTLSLDFPKGRSDRSAFFQKELGEFLKMTQEQKLDPTAVLGSYAGALGWPQFMPSSVRRYAVDFDGDGRIDLQRSPVDAIGSVANYLAAHGWKKGVPPSTDVTPPKQDAALAKLLEPDIRPTFSLDEMRSLGASLPEPVEALSGRLAFVKLENGDAAPTYVIGTENFYAITRYNQSSYYALAVIQLGEAVEKAAQN